MFFVKRKKSWKNWSESVIVEPKSYYEPNHLEQLRDIVKQCAEKNITIRVVGAGHSFTPLVATSDVLISLNRLCGINHIDEENKCVTVWAGTRLKDLGPQLFAHGYAMENLGDINEQTIAGAISTGTHGTGSNFGNLSSQVAGVTLLTATGELLEISKTKNSTYFEASRLSLGMLGIIVKVTLKVVDHYHLVENSYRLSLSTCLHELDSLRQLNRNFEFFWFPYTETVQVKTLNDIKQMPRKHKKQQIFKKVVIENGLFWVLSEMSRRVPQTSRMVSAISASGIPKGEEINDSHLVYATPRFVKFQEMEYSVPAEAMADVLQDIKKMLNKKRYRVHFPIECRYVKGDSIYLSPSYQRESAYIAVHMYKGMPFNDYFQAIEEIFHTYNGRPHWGKMHTMNADTLMQVFPKLNDFLHVRQWLDQDGLFLNTYLKRLLKL